MNLESLSQKLESVTLDRDTAIQNLRDTEKKLSAQAETSKDLRLKLEHATESVAQYSKVLRDLENKNRILLEQQCLTLSGSSLTGLEDYEKAVQARDDQIVLYQKCLPGFKKEVLTMLKMIRKDMETEIQKFIEQTNDLQKKAMQEESKVLDLESESKQLKKDLNSCKVSLKEKEDLSTSLEKSNKEKDKLLKDLQQQICSLEENMKQEETKAKDSLRIQTERISDLDEENLRYRNECSQLKELLMDTEKRQEQIEMLQAKIADTKDIEEISKKLEKETIILKRDAEKSKQDAISYQSTSAKVQEVCDKLKVENESLTKMKESLENKATNFENRSHNLEKKLQDAKDKRREDAELVQRYVSSIKDKEVQIKKLSKQIKEIKEENRKLNTPLQDTKKQYEKEIKNLTKEFKLKEKQLKENSRKNVERAKKQTTIKQVGYGKSHLIGVGVATVVLCVLLHVCFL